MTRFSLAGLLAAMLVLGACTSIPSVLQPSALTSPGAGGHASRGATLAGQLSLHFAPTIGATAEANRPLAARLSSRADEIGISISAADAGADLSMTGYFSAITEDGATTVIYVWDVFDQQGNRVHRIQGQQGGPSAAGEGWTAVSDETMEAVADETMNQLVSWLAARQEN